MKKKLRLIEQNEHSECGLACVAMLLNYCNVKTSLNELRNTYGVPRGGLNLLNLKQVMEDNGIKTKAYKVEDSHELEKLKIKSPFLCNWESNHFVIINAILHNKVIVFDPAIGKRKITLSEFRKSFGGVVLFIDEISIKIGRENGINSKKNKLQEIIFKFLKKNLVVLFMIFIEMIILQLVYLCIPLLIRKIIDNNSTIYNFVILKGIILLGTLLLVYFLLEYTKGLFVTILQFRFNKQLMQIYINKIIKLEFKHFINRSSGDWIYRSNVIEYIQQILSPQFMVSIIDLFFVIIYFLIMLKYSIILSTITIFTSLILISISILNVRFVLDLNSKEIVLQSKVQNTMIEFFEGIETIKSLKLEKNIRKNG